MIKKRFFGFMLLVLFVFTASSQHIPQPPLMGWSSWNTYGFQINDSVIKAQADAMVQLGFKDCGYDHINIDDGFFGGRDAQGNLLIHPERFPNGLRPLVDYIHSQGLKAGIYSDAGRNTCASYWGKPKDEIGRGVGLYGHDAADFDLYFNPDKLNFDFIKIDYCGADANNNEDKLDLNVEQRYKEIAAAIKAVGRDDITWNICRWAFPGTWACEIADSWRTTEDIYLGWESVKSIINQSLYLSAYTSYGHYNDMDMLEVGRGLTEEEDKTHFGMWCIMSSPLLIGCDMNDIKGNALELMQNKELIALNQNTLGQQAYVVKKENGCYILVKDAEELNGNKRAVAFYNPTNSSVTASVEFSMLDLRGNVKVRDLFEKQDVGVKSGSMSVSVPAHGTRIYLLEAEERLERTVYEAETAWLSAYQELKNHEVEGTANYVETASCSGGAKVSYLGNRAENDLQWRNVYSNNGGEYTMRLYYITGEERPVKISVNGGEPIVVNVNSGGWNAVASEDVKIVLEKGVNVIRLYSDNGWMPDIDCMKLVADGGTDIPDVPAAPGFDASKLYRIYNQKQESGASNNDATLMAIAPKNDTQACMKAFDVNDESQVWQFVEDRDKYKIRNVSTGKWLGAVAAGAVPVPLVNDEAGATSYTMEINGNNTYAFWHGDRNTKGNWLWNDGGGNLYGWYDDTNRMQDFYLEVVEVETVTPEELLAAREAFDVAYAIAKENIDASDLIYQKGDDLPLQTTAPDSPYYIWTNAQEQSEGPISQLVDGKVENKNFFHTTWNNPPAGPHYIEVDLGENNDLAQFVISYSTRINSDGPLADFPDAIEILGCNEKDGAYTHIATLEDNLPQEQGQRWESSIVVNEGFRFLRFNVSAEKTFWHMAEFDITRMSASIDDMYKGVFDEVVALKAEYERMADNADYSYAELLAATKALNEAIAAVVYMLNVTETGYATLYLDRSAVIPDLGDDNGVYIVNEVNDNYAIMEKVTGVLPAETGVVVKANSGSYKFVYTIEDGNADFNKGLMNGSVNDENVEGDVYVLDVVDGVVGLYKAEMAGGVWLNNANNAYLPKPVGADAAYYTFRFDADTPTGVENVEFRNGKEEIYDLTGRRVNALERGIYITGGKKILVK